MSEYLILLKRELKSITKEKTIMFAIMIQFFIASFSSIILVGIMAFYDPTSIAESTRVTLTVGAVSGARNPILGYLRDRGVIVNRFSNLADAEAAFRSGRIDAVMFIPPSRSGVVDMQLILPKLDTKKTIIMMTMDEPLKRYENYLREANGIELRYKNSGGSPSTTYEFLYSIIIPILMLFPALIAGSVVIDTVSEELENKTFDTLMSAPVSLGQILAAKVSAAIITAAIQVIMWAGLLRLNGIIIYSPALVLLLAAIVAASVSFIAAMAALYFKDRERAQFVYSIALIVGVGGSYFLNPSPLSLITQLAAGAPAIGLAGVALYTILPIIMATVFFNVSKRLISARQ